MAISSANATKINKMNRAAQNVNLGTIVKNLQTYVGGSGSFLVTTPMMSASRVPIIDANCTKGIIWKYVRSGSPVSTIKELIWTPASGCMILCNYNLNSGSVLVGDEVHYIGF